MSNEIIAIQNVHGYVDEQGTVWLNTKDVAIGLGFVEVKYRGATSCANTEGTLPFSIRWRTIRKYLEEFGFRQEVGEGSFIPENMFYRLAMKARNETAERFQAKVADEILPSIRKTGMYKVVENPPLTYLEALKQLVAKEEAYQKEKERADVNQEAADFQKQATSKNIKYRIGTAAKCLNFEGLGQNKLFSFLRDDLGVLFYNYDGMNEVKQEQIKLGRFQMKFNENYEYPVVYITVNGMRWVYNKLLEYDYKPLMSFEEWERRCQKIQDNEE